ncbi:MAG: YceI family protein [Deltaproteobacteria bacterium]|nr:YceI family protein [Deltaproteobacteria bacterium]
MKTVRGRHLIAVLGGLLIAPSTSFAETWNIDPVHSAVVFKTLHFGAGYTYGMFRKFSGKIEAAKPIGKSSVSIEIDAESVYTGEQKRDKHLRSPDFLNVKQFPKITFVSSAVRGSVKNITVSGKLTLHGTTKDVTVRLTKVGEGKDPWGNQRIGFEGTLKIKRTEYGMKKMIGPAADEIQLILAFEAIKAK